MRNGIATDLHPHYPTEWLNGASASTRCALKNVPFRATLTWCRKHSLEVSSSGHIRALSLQLYIDRYLADRMEV